MTTPFQLSLPLVSVDSATPRASEILASTKASMGMVPNMYAAMGNVAPLLETYTEGYARFRRESGFTPAEQEVVFLTISRVNGCEYCVSAHSMLSEKVSNVPADVVRAIRQGEHVEDARLGPLVRFTAHFVETRGRPTQQVTAQFLNAGFTEAHILHVLLATAVKTISNYTNHLFDTPLDAAFATHRWSAPASAIAI